MGACSIPSATAQSFSCTFGEPACLDYGAIVCKRSAKCVSDDAVCFDSYTCDYKGFACKSDYDKAVDEIDEKVRKYNTLVDGINSATICIKGGETADDALDCMRRYLPL